MLTRDGTLPEISRFASDHHITAGPLRLPSAAWERFSMFGRISPTYAVGSRGPYISRLIIGLDLQTTPTLGHGPIRGLCLTAIDHDVDAAQNLTDSCRAAGDGF